MAIPLRFPAVVAFVGFDSPLGPVAVSCGLPHPAARTAKASTIVIQKPRIDEPDFIHALHCDF
jgi:hypothetical protein